MIEETRIVKIKNKILADIEDSRAYTHKVNDSRMSPELIDIIFDHERDAVIRYYYSMVD